jgi:hypothetical protein
MERGVMRRYIGGGGQKISPGLAVHCPCLVHPPARTYICGRVQRREVKKVKR